MAEKTKAHRAQRGTLFACSWGYDQTNVDYYVVTRATPSMAYIAKIDRGDVQEIGDKLAGEEWETEVTKLYADGSIRPAGRFKIHDAAQPGRDALRDPDSRYGLWFAPYSFANAYWWRGEELYSTPAGYGH